MATKNLARTLYLLSTAVALSTANKFLPDLIPPGSFDGEMDQALTEDMAVELLVGRAAAAGVIVTTSDPLCPKVPDNSSLPNAKYLGCYQDRNATTTPNIFLLDGPMYRDNLTTSGNVTWQSCQTWCGPGYTFFGIEFSRDCRCGNTFMYTPQIVGPETLCDRTCNNNATQACGGTNRMTLFANNRIVSGFLWLLTTFSKEWSCFQKEEVYAPVPKRSQHEYTQSPIEDVNDF
ncbi:hypothetical protein B0J11DRAFT_606543 [Dendryphion nanum]|uniref:WSC domain-containing protein n=1 Tax=Dendryphion nanum TaxID=256645 RepID=A0A9P9ILK1_9PLEO|nr:hypothetical protein B0J11DRAFT_606543 [Dendryphion nanum]